MEAASGKKNGSKTVVGSEEGKTGSKASGSSQGRENEDSSSHPSKYVPSVGDIVWLNTTAHPAWPVLVCFSYLTGRSAPNIFGVYCCF